jgi:hypothetical protein
MSSPNMGFAKAKNDTFLLYSYYTVVGIVTKDGNAVMTTKKYSPTTSKHQSYLRRFFNPVEIPEELFRPMANQFTSITPVRYIPNCKWKRETIDIPPIKQPREIRTQTRW